MASRVGLRLLTVAMLLGMASSPTASAAVTGTSVPDLSALVPGLSGVPKGPLTGSSVVEAIGAEPAMVAEVNRMRRARQLRPFRYSRSLRRSARRYARWLLANDSFGHLARIQASRRFRRLGEALAWHSGLDLRIQATVRDWLHSPPHRRLLLNRRFLYLGAGKAYGPFRGGDAATIWVLHVGA
jgi:uncharacterized protein YkwD